MFFVAVLMDFPGLEKMGAFTAVLIMSCFCNTVRQSNKPTLTIFGYLKKKNKYKIVIPPGCLFNFSNVYIPYVSDESVLYS